jgi:iron complex transport system substrate-binding protein
MDVMKQGVFILNTIVNQRESAKVWFVALAFVAFIFSACTPQQVVNSNSAAEQPDSSPKAVPMRIVTDDLGRQITVPVKITRAISLAPSVTESIFAVGAGDRLVGDTTYCNYPEEAKSIQKVGDTLNPNIETIVALKPDVVFVSGASQLENFTNILDQNGIAVYVMNPLDLDAVLHNIEQLGIIFETSDKSKELVRDLSDREMKIRTAVGAYIDESQADYDKRVGTLRVLVQISKEPLFTIGKGSFLNALILSAGGRSVTDNVTSAYPKLSKETALALQPEVIILSDSADNQEPNEVFKNSPAVKNGRVFKINADIISRPGPRLVDALEQIAKDLHPEKFQ